MSVRRYGDGDRHIVYLHGLGEAGGVFQPLLHERVLRDRSFTHTVPDLPGYGRSAWPEPPLGLDARADQLTTWLAGFPTPVVLVGHSMGGVLAVLVAEKSPSVVKAIVNVEGNVSLDDCFLSGGIAASDESSYAAEGHEAIAWHLLSLAVDGSPESFHYAAFRFADPASTHRHARDLVELSATESMAERMAALTVPCVFVAGVPRGIAPRSLELLDTHGVRTVRVEPCGHWVYWDQPAVCAEVVAGLA
ncbi:MAG TPA: alpha/beta hydrolase [Candidatus Limnocylindrales bacterium]